MWTVDNELIYCSGTYCSQNIKYCLYQSISWTNSQFSVFRKYLFISARYSSLLMFTWFMFCNSVNSTVKIVYCFKQKSQIHHSVHYSQSLLTSPSLQNSPFIIFLPQYAICCFIHTVCCKHVSIHCPSTILDGLIGLGSVIGLHQGPLPVRSCFLVWSVDVCSDVSVFTLYVEWP